MHVHDDSDGSQRNDPTMMTCIETQDLKFWTQFLISELKRKTSQSNA
jgi:hypothetical protein